MSECDVQAMDELIEGGISSQQQLWKEMDVLRAKNKALLEALEDYLYSGIIQGMSQNTMHYADVSKKCLCLQCINKRARKAIQGEEG